MNWDLGRPTLAQRIRCAWGVVWIAYPLIRCALGGRCGAVADAEGLAMAQLAGLLPDWWADEAYMLLAEDAYRRDPELRRLADEVFVDVNR